MSKTTPERNKTLVLEAFDTLFNKRDYAAAERYWSDRYIQHSAHISPGRIGLFNAGLGDGVAPLARQALRPRVPQWGLRSRGGSCDAASRRR